MFGILKRLLGGAEPAATVLLPAEFQAGLEHTARPQLVDVRTPQEYKAGHLKNAKNINLYSPDFLEQIRKLDAHRPVFLYCRSGRRSQMAARRMKKVGFAELYDLGGGYLAWQHYTN